MENRTWRTDRTSPILIHAGLKMPRQDYHEARRLCERLGIELPPPERLDHGGIVGRAELTGCVTGSGSPWFFGPYGFTFAEAQPLPFRPARGALGFFELADRGRQAAGDLFNLVARRND